MQLSYLSAVGLQDKLNGHNSDKLQQKKQNIYRIQSAWHEYWKKNDTYDDTQLR